MSHFGMVIDIGKCTGCFNCFLACRDEYFENDYPPYSAAQPLNGQFWMHIKEVERGRYPKPKLSYIPILCTHCQSAPCTEASENGAVYRREDGIVIIDPVKAQGQKQIVSSCPHRVIFWNEETNIPQKCTLCAHLLDQGWKEPRCVEACPTGAIVFGDLDDPNSQISQILASKDVEELHPEYGLKPRVKYIGLPKRFVAGTVVFGDDDSCAGGVDVVLHGEGSEKRTKTDNFGDFEFDGLRVGRYSLETRHKDYYPQILTVDTTADVYVGEIVLQRR